MAKLVHSTITSVDGYVEDEEGKFDWAAPDDDEVHALVNDLEPPIGTYLYGRRMYETMLFWETVSTGADQPAVIRDFAEIWRAAEKIVYSRTLQTVSSARTRVERDFDSDAIRWLKETSGSDITSAGRARLTATNDCGVPTVPDHSCASHTCRQSPTPFGPCSAALHG